MGISPIVLVSTALSFNDDLHFSYNRKKGHDMLLHIVAIDKVLERIEKWKDLYGSLIFHQSGGWVMEVQ